MIKIILKILIQFLISSDVAWNDKYTKYECKRCFWQDLGLDKVHKSHNVINSI